MRLHSLLFTDGQPEDSLFPTRLNADRWHTNVFWMTELNKRVDALLETSGDFQAALKTDSTFRSLTDRFSPLRKWSGKGKYRQDFVQQWDAIRGTIPVINAISFRESDLRKSKTALLKKYNDMFSGPGIGFEERVDDKGRVVMKHSLLNSFTGLTVFERLEDQMLVLLLVASVICDQFIALRNDAEKRGFSDFRLTVVSDTLKGDDSTNHWCQNFLNFLVDPDDVYHSQSSNPIDIIKSPVSDTFEGDLLVDNLAGLLNSCLEKPDALTDSFLRSRTTNCLGGWMEFVLAGDTISFEPILPKIRQQRGTST